MCMKLSPCFSWEMSVSFSILLFVLSFDVRNIRRFFQTCFCVNVTPLGLEPRTPTLSMFTVASRMYSLYKHRDDIQTGMSAVEKCGALPAELRSQFFCNSIRIRTWISWVVPYTHQTKRYKFRMVAHSSTFASHAMLPFDFDVSDIRNVVQILKVLTFFLLVFFASVVCGAFWANFNEFASVAFFERLIVSNVGRVKHWSKRPFVTVLLCQFPFRFFVVSSHIVLSELFLMLSIYETFPDNGAC